MLPSFWIHRRCAAWFAALAAASSALLGPGCLARYSNCPTPGCLAESSPDSLGGRSDGADGGDASLGGGTGTAGAAGWAGNGGLGGELTADPGPLATLGHSCANEGELGCATVASRFPLRCEGGVWTSAGQCSLTERCASEGDGVGTCQEAIPECLEKDPGDWVCRDALRFRCGVDLLDEDQAESCANGCIEGVCAECIPGDDATCTHNSVRSCSAAGSWEETPCPAAAPLCSSGICGLPPSCLELAQTCGPAPAGGSGSENCCTSLLVPGDTFNRDNNTAYPATISTFRLDRFEVTVGRFRKFKAAWDDGWRPSAGDGKHGHLNDGLGLHDPNQAPEFEAGWQSAWTTHVAVSDSTLSDAGSQSATWTASPGVRESRPINFVNLFEALAFCIWDEGFLPSRAESSFAASGGDEQRTYPWGEDQPTVELAIYDCRYNPDGVCDRKDIAAVGFTAGAGRFGQLDLVGNIAEWNQGDQLPMPCDDCMTTSGTSATTWGGSFEVPAALVQSKSAVAQFNEGRAFRTGLRCARPP